MSPRRRVRFIVIPVALLALAAVAVGLWAWNAAGRSTEVSEPSAIDDFRGRHAASPAARGPAPGVYTYLQRGREEAGVGPASISRGLPGEARYVITPVDGGYEEELSLAAEHVEAVRFATLAGGARRAVWRRTAITVVGIGRDDRRDLIPPPLDRPADLVVGSAWTARYRLGEVPVTSRSDVLRAEAVRVGGRRLPALVIRTVADSGGVLPGRRVDVVWWSTRLQLPLRWEIDAEVDGVVRITTRTTLRLRDARPRV